MNADGMLGLIALIGVYLRLSAAGNLHSGPFGDLFQFGESRSAA
jgi:hypothetical protein